MSVPSTLYRISLWAKIDAISFGIASSSANRPAPADLTYGLWANIPASSGGTQFSGSLGAGPAGG